MSLSFSEHLRAALAPPRYLAFPLSGIDISTSGVKAVRLAERPHGLVLAAHADEQLEPGAFIEGEYAEPAVIAAALARAAARADIESANAALPEPKSYLFETTAPGVTPDEWRTLVEQHLDELVPLPPEETAFDVMPVGYGEEGPPRLASGEAGNRFLVGVGFARRVVDGALAVFDAAGLEVGALEGEMFAMARALLSEGDTSTTLIIDVGKTTTKIAITVSRIPRFTTTIGIGGHAFTLAIQKHFGVTEQEARQVKVERGMVSAPGNEDYLAAMLSTAAAIKDEISHWLEYWQGHGAESGGHQPVVRALLVGGNASVRGFREYLESALGIPVATGDVFTNFAPRDYWIPDLNSSESLAYATAIGLALRDHAPSSHV
ncbi:MAG: pilus assembly protein PilM [bacterium]|nr:pilus assembly protein PilM [bacterium]